MSTQAKVDDRGTGPFWGARVYPPRTGQDHLGLGSVSSDRILTQLSPGVNVLTIHPRYWAFYSLVLDDFWRTELPRNKARFRAYYRPREAMFAIACQLCTQPEHDTLGGNIVGTQRTQVMAAHDELFDPATDYIKEDLGGYGLYYRTVMETMGLVVRPGDAGVPFDAPTPEGQAVAAGYRTAIQDTAFYQQHWRTLDRPVPRDVLHGFAAKACLCQLRKAHSHDLPLLQDLFLHAGHASEAAARMATFRFLLDLAAAPGIGEIDRDVFRQLVYFRDVDGGKYEPRDGVQDTARAWRLYQAREYFAYALNRLWAWTVRRGMDWTDDGVRSLPFPDLQTRLGDSFDSNQFARDLGLRGGRLRSTTTLAEALRRLENAVDLGPGIDQVWPRHPALDEHALYSWVNNDTDDPETLVACLVMLLLVYRRTGTPSTLVGLDPLSRSIHAAGESARIGMTMFMVQLHARVKGGETLGGMLQWVIDQYVLTQHERIAVGKLPDDTFRFRRLGKDVRFIGGPTPVGFTDSRYLALSATIHELGLVGSLRRLDHQPTSPGRELLSDGDLPAGALADAARPYIRDPSP